MAVVQSLGSLRRLAGVDPSSGWFPSGGGDSSLYRGDYANMYRTQPAVRVCVEFLARNIAQLGIHVFTRVADDSRVRTRDGAGYLLAHPNGWTSRFRLFYNTTSDLGIFGNAYWLKVGQPGDVEQLVRLHPRTIDPVATVSGVVRYDFQGANGKIVPLDPWSVVHFRWYDPDSDARGASPLEALRRTLAEDRAAADHRSSLWRNGARIGGYIKRPKTAPQWSNDAKDKFQRQFSDRYGGPQNAGRIPILEDDMEFKEAAFSPSQTEDTASRKLRLEEVTRTYQIPLPFAGILEHATFSNIKEQHKHLYADCLGPILVMMEEEIELNLLPDFAAADRSYCEFNIAEKLKGSFEEQATALSKLTGGPVMTPNEGRARLNLPRVDDPTADELRQPPNADATVDRADAKADDDDEDAEDAPRRGDPRRDRTAALAAVA